MNFTFYRLNLGNNHVCHIVVSNETKIIKWINGPYKRPTNIWFPVGWNA